MNQVFDCETLINCSTFVFEEADVEEGAVVEEFVIHDLRDDRLALYDFFKRMIHSKGRFVSFNGIAFDSQIVEYLIRNENSIMELPPNQVAYNIYLKAQEAIRRSNAREFSEYAPFDLSIKHIDIFKQGNFNSAAKRASLKYLQFTTDWHNIEDMPIHHSTIIKTVDQINEILSYCRNDVSSTKHLYKIFAPQTEQRLTFSKKYKTDLLSSSEPGIAKKIFSYYLAPLMGLQPSEFKNLRTFRTEIVVKDLILPYVKFQTPEFNGLLEAFKDLIIDPDNTKDAFKYTINYKGIKIDFGLGGVHGSRPPGVYESTSKFSLESADVVSYYPNLIIKNKWSPAHIPIDIFCTQYEWFFIERLKTSKKDPINYLFKIILNATFGLSKEKNNPLYDPLLAMATTINGQLSLMMWYEDVMMKIPEAVPVLVNTDGGEFLIPRDKLELYKQCCTDWEKTTQLTLEYDSYKSLIIRDVNNYCGIFTERKCTAEEYEKYKKKKIFPVFIRDEQHYYHPTKCKGGIFEFEDLALHKNKSFLIIRKALYNYFVFGQMPEITLANNKNIFDYCGGIKANSEWKVIMMCHNQGTVEEIPLQKVNRYFVSRKGCKIIKVNTIDGRKIQQHSGNVYQTLYNVHIPEYKWKDYNINDKFYLDIIYSEIANIVHKKENLLF